MENTQLNTVMTQLEKMTVELLEKAQREVVSERNMPSDEVKRFRMAWPDNDVMQNVYFEKRVMLRYMYDDLKTFKRELLGEYMRFYDADDLVFEIKDMAGAGHAILGSQGEIQEFFGEAIREEVMQILEELNSFGAQGGKKYSLEYRLKNSEEINYAFSDNVKDVFECFAWVHGLGELSPIADINLNVWEEGNGLEVLVYTNNESRTLTIRPSLVNVLLAYDPKYSSPTADADMVGMRESAEIMEVSLPILKLAQRRATSARNPFTDEARFTLTLEVPIDGKSEPRNVYSDSPVAFRYLYNEMMQCNVSLSDHLIFSAGDNQIVELQVTPEGCGCKGVPETVAEFLRLGIEAERRQVWTAISEAEYEDEGWKIVFKLADKPEAGDVKVGREDFMEALEHFACLYELNEYSLTSQVSFFSPDGTLIATFFPSPDETGEDFSSLLDPSKAPPKPLLEVTDQDLWLGLLNAYKDQCQQV